MHRKDRNPDKETDLVCEWMERITELRSNLDYAAKFTAAGESYSELDDAGEIKFHRPTDDVS